MLLVGRRTTFECLKQEGCDVLGSLKPEQWHQARAIVCQSILHTDMIKHDEMMSMLGNKKVILPTASGVSNEGGSSPLLAPLPAVSWRWVPAWGSLEPPRRGGENAQKTGKNGAKMGEIRGLRSVKEGS